MFKYLIFKFNLYLIFCERVSYMILYLIDLSLLKINYLVIPNFYLNGRIYSYNKY